MSWFTKVLLTKSSLVNQSFTHIANDGNLLPAPLRDTRKVLLGIAGYPLGTRLSLINRLVQTDGKGPEGPFG